MKNIFLGYGQLPCATDSSVYSDSDSGIGFDHVD